MHFLQHLEDCNRIAKDCCHETRRNVQVLLDQVNLIETTRSDSETSLINKLELAREDLDYLHGEIESLLQRLPDRCHDIREHLDLVQIRRTWILGVLAGLYLPLSFVTVGSWQWRWSLEVLRLICMVSGLLGYEYQPKHASAVLAQHYGYRFE